MEVHKILGPGFLKAVYEEALAHEFDLQSIKSERQKDIKVKYKEIVVKEYTADFLVEKKVVVEIKAMKQLTDIDEAQLQNYLKASEIRVGLLINFGEKSLKYKRIIR